MIKKLTKTFVLLLTIGFLVVLVGCDEFFNNENTSDVELVNITFNYHIDDLEPVTIKLKKNQKMIEPQSPKRSGFIFMGWFNDELRYDFNLIVEEDLILDASWEDYDGEEEFDNYLVTFNYNITNVLPQTIKVLEGDLTVEPTVPLNEGNEFLGWFVNITDENPFDFNTPINNHLGLIAKWEEKEPIVILEEVFVNYIYDNGFDPVEINIYKGNKAIEPISPTKNGYVFNGWYKDLQVESAYNFQTSVNEDLTLYAKWSIEDISQEEKEDVLVTFDYNISSVNNISVKVEKGKEVVEAVPLSNEGYKFIGWYEEGKVIPFDFKEKLYDDVTLIASWEEFIPTTIYYDVTYVVFGDEFTVTTTHVEENTIINMPEDPTKEYHQFDGWYEEDSIESFNFNEPINKNIVLIAQFSIQYDLIYVTFEYGNESEIVVINLGSTVDEFEVEESEDYVLIGWLDASGNFFNFDTKIYENMTLTAYLFPTAEVDINYISKHVVRANVKILKQLYLGRTGNYYTGLVSSSIGSGSIIKQDGNDYYVITNAHVVSRDYVDENGNKPPIVFPKYEVYDYLDRSYSAVVFDTTLFVSEEYDLAIVKFTTDEEGLNVIEISETLDKTKPLVLVGQPHGQKNTITVGMFNRSLKVLIDGIEYSSNLIDAPGAPGSSGSMVIDYKYELVGVIFAGKSKTDFVDSTYMHAVPLDLIHEFLDPFFDLFVDPFIYQLNHINNHNYFNIKELS